MSVKQAARSFPSPACAAWTRWWRTRAPEAALPAGVDLTAYRIAQEALTNVRKHSNGTHVAVRIDCAPGMVRIEVTDDGAPAPPDADCTTHGSHASGSPDATGYGLVGMRERTALYGGTLEAGPLAGGGFRVAATLPFHVEQVPAAPRAVSP